MQILIASLFGLVLIYNIINYRQLAKNMFNIYISSYVFFEKKYKQIFETFKSKHIRIVSSHISCITNGIEQIRINSDANNSNNLNLNVHLYDLVLHRTQYVVNIYAKYAYRMTRLNKDSDLMNLPKESAFKLLEILIYDNDRKYIIDFGPNNYYIVGNILLDKHFIKWYLLKYLSVDISDTYTCIIMDDNIKLITLNKDNCIQVTEDSYNIVSVL